MLVKDLRLKNKNELTQLIEDLKAELFKLKFQNKTGQLDKTHKISIIKKDIAKVFTILNARKLKIEKENKSIKTTSQNGKKYNDQSKIKSKEVKEAIVKKVNKIDKKVKENEKE